MYMQFTSTYKVRGILNIPDDVDFTRRPKSVLIVAAYDVESAIATAKKVWLEKWNVQPVSIYSVNATPDGPVYTWQE